MAIPSISVTRVDTGPGPLVHETKVRATFQPDGATDSILLARTNGVSAPVAGGVLPFRSSTLASDHPSSKTSNAAQVLRIAAEQAGDVGTVVVDDSVAPPVVSWGPREGAQMIGRAPLDEAPGSIRDILAASSTLTKRITGGPLLPADDSFVKA